MIKNFQLILAEPYCPVFAKIDTKYVVIQVEDGYDGPGTTNFQVNLMAGYAAGLATIAVDTGTGTIATGDRLTFSGHDTIYTVTAHSETSSNTTSITFTPVLTDAIVDNEVITILPHYVEVKLGEGNLTWTDKKAYTYVKERGLLDTVTEDDQQEMDVKLDSQWIFLKASSGGTATVEDAMKKRGGASGWTSSSSDLCEPYAVNIRATYTPPCDDEDIEIYLFEDFRYESAEHDLNGATVSFTGKCNRTEPTITRVPQ